MNNNTTYAQASAKQFADEFADTYNKVLNPKETVRMAYLSGLYTKPSNLEIQAAYEAMAEYFTQMREEYIRDLKPEDLIQYAQIALNAAWEVRNRKQMPVAEAEAFVKGVRESY